MTGQFSSHDFRKALGLFATGVCIVTTKYKHEQFGITINSFSSVSLDPALVLFSISHKLYSFDAFRQANGFTINVLGCHQEYLSTRFARAGADKWKDLITEPGKHDGLIIPDVLASLDCRKYAAHDGGDHLIVVGEVTGIRTSADTDPLIYYRSNYRHLAALKHCAVA